MIEAKNLTVFRGERPICRNIELSVAEGSCHGVLGPNGSGKTSLLLGLRGLLPVSGSVNLAGVEPRCTPRTQLARLVAVVPQRMEFAFPYTVEEMVLLGRTPHRHPWEAFRDEDRRLVAEILERLGLAELSRERVDAISGGERRKVFLARALAQKTRLLFLDEPIAGLDPKAQEELVRLIHELRDQQGMTVVVVLHDVRLVARLCDGVLALKDGEAIWQGDPGEVMSGDSLEELFGVEWELYQHPEQPPVWISQGGPS
ncbi:MAG: ABC transporter ATP-binding protein [Planctomycetota bacterium]